MTVPTQPTRPDLAGLEGIDLAAVVRCAWPDGCEREAAWLMVQLHTRPPFACSRVHLCEQHRQEVLAGERAMLRGQATGRKARIGCTLHHRQVETLARWEPL